MGLHSIQIGKSIPRFLWRPVAALVLSVMAPLGLAQSISPSSENFGNVPLTVPVTRTETFTNNPFTGGPSYTITGLATSDPRFVAVGSGPSPCNIGVVVLFSASCTYSLTFTPAGTGAYNNTTTLTTSGPTILQASSGTGFIPPLTLSPASAAFGNLPVSLPATQSFTFNNTSNTTAFPSTYTINSLVTSGLGYSAVGSGPTPCGNAVTVAPGASCGVTVTFVPAGVGSSNGTTTINYLAGLGTDPPYSATFGSTGTGFAPPATLTPTGASFGSLPVGSSATQSFNFNNTSNSTAFPSTYTINAWTTTIKISYTVDTYILASVNKNNAM